MYMSKTYQELKQLEQNALRLAGKYASDAEQVKTTEIKQAGINGWLDYEFESSSGLTPEFAEFSKQMKKELKKRLSGWEIVSYSRGHFYISAFAKHNTTGKMVYINCSDVRYSPNGWYNNLLVRTAEHDKDFTGGSNDWATLDGLKDKAEYLTR